MNDFDDISDLDEVFGPLRSAATPAELAQEAAIVERMANARHISKGTTMFTSRRARIATLVAAGVLGFGGMAAASPSLLGQPSDEPVTETTATTEAEPVTETTEAVTETTEVVTETTEVVTETTEATEVVTETSEVELAPVVDETPVAEANLLSDDPSTAFDETTCLPGNHGATVSAVARGEFGPDVAVSDAAKSSCGKKHRTVAEPEPAPPAEPATASDPTITPVPEPERTDDRDQGGASNGKSNGKANGHSNGQGNGKGSGKRGG